MVGAIMAIAFKNVRFKFDHKIAFNAAMMTGNMRSMMMTLADAIKTKNKEKWFQSFCYLVMIFCFSFGVLVTALCGVFAPIP